MWCRHTDGPERKLLDQVKRQQLRDYELPPNTYHNTQHHIDLTIVHTSLAGISEWSLYDNLLSDHYPIMLTIQTENIPPADGLNTMVAPT